MDSSLTEGLPVRRDKVRLTVMFDIAQFYKLRHEKQTYDSIITRSSMIRPYQRSGKVWFWVEPTQ